MTISSRRLGATIAFLVFVTTLLPAAIKLPAIFGDHMVLQAGAKLPVWGTAAPGEAVTVTLAGESAKTTADASGHWRVDLASLPAQGAPTTMTVVGTNTLTFQDVVLGEVWVCSGQSNMELPLVREYDAATKIPLANDPQLRIFLVAKKPSLDPVDDVSGKWELCTPDSIAKFSAAGYFFGRDLRQALKRPVGLIGSYWGGTPAQAWTSESGLQKDPELKHYLDFRDQTKAHFAQATADYPQKMTAYNAVLEAWRQGAGKTYIQQVQGFNAAMKQAQASGQPAPAPPQPSVPMPRPPVSPEGGSSGPANLYNGMIAPLIPYAIQGVIWYQGEANASAAAEYRVLFSRMITDWREKWGEGNFTFLFVQLAGYETNGVLVGPNAAKIRAGTNATWPWLRDSQTATLALPKTGMATAIDIGNRINIHPTDKEDVGGRLALLARHLAYGETLVDSGPMYRSMTVQGHAISLSFKETGGGLVIGKAPWVAPTFQPIPTDKLRGFEVAGADQAWVPADAKIVGPHVVVSSAQVPAPVAVRYDWAGDPEGNLYNAEGLPSPSFRTDDWPQPSAAKPAPPGKPKSGA